MVYIGKMVINLSQQAFSGKIAVSQGSRKMKLTTSKFEDVMLKKEIYVGSYRDK